MKLPDFRERVLAAALIISAAACSTLTAENQSVDFLLEHEREWLNNNIDSIELWYSPDYPPLEYADPQGDFIGMGADLFVLIEEQLDVEFPKKICYDWNELSLALRDGECAVAPTIVKNAAREEYINFTTPYAEVEMVIVSDDTHARDLGLDEIKDLRVAAVSGYASSDYIREHSVVFSDFITVKDVEEGLKLVAFGQADVFIESIAVISHYIRELGITNLSVSGVLDYDFSFSIGISRKYPVLYTILQKALSEISDDELAALRLKYIDIEPHSGLSPVRKRILLAAVAGLGIILLAALIAAFKLKSKLKTNLRSLSSEQEKNLENTERYKALFMNAPIALLEMKKNGDIVQVNEVFTEVLGYSKEDLPNLDVWFELAYSDEDIRRRKKAAWAREQAEEAVFKKAVEHGEYRLRCKNGTERVFIISINEAYNNYIFSFNDIDDQKRLAAEIEKSRDLFYTLFELAPFSCVINRFNGEILDANKHYCKKLGKTKVQIVGLTNEDLQREVDPESKAAIMEQLKTVGFCRVDEVRLKAEGGDTWVLFASQVIDWGAEKAILSVTIDISRKKEAELELERHKEHLEQLVVERTKELEAAIEERKQKEAQLIQSEKMASLGVLTAGLSHEINNPLNFLMGAYINLADYFSAAGVRDESIDLLLEGMKEGIDRTASIVKGLNQFGEDGQGFDYDCNIAAIINNCLLALKAEMNERITVEKDFPEPAVIVRGNHGKLHQVFFNVLRNAHQAIDGAGRIDIKISSNGDEVAVLIKDNGRGIAHGEIPKIIEPFYKIDNSGPGAGLGLSVCYNILQEHKGRIEFESVPGEGTSVRISINGRINGAETENSLSG